MAEVRLQDAMKEFEDRVNVRWKSFMLRPEPDPSVTFDDYRRGHWMRARMLEPRCEFRPWESDEPYPNTSFPALVAAKAAQRQGEELAERYHLALFESIFRDNRNIADESVLLEIARCCRLDTKRLQEDMRDAALRKEIFDEYNEALRMGIHAIPAVNIGGQAIIGAVESDSYRKAIAAELSSMESL